MLAIRGWFGVAIGLIRMFHENGRWWLIPFVFVLFGAALLLAGIQAIEYVAPFVYSIF
jgi:hypothetical protein